MTVIPIAALTDQRETRLAGVSADGTVMGYLSNRSGLSQIWFSAQNGANLRQVTDLPERVVQIAFEPKGGDLIFTTDVGMDERHQLWLLPAGQKTPVALTQSPTVVHLWGGWSPDGDAIAYAANDRDPYVMDILVMDMATRTPKRIYRGDCFQEVLCWTSDGTGLIVRAARNGSADQTLLRVDIEGGHVTPLLTPDRRVTYLSVKPIKDVGGSYILADLDGVFHALYHLPLDEQPRRIVHDPHHDITAFAVSPDQQQVTVIVNKDGFSTLRLHAITADTDHDIPLPFKGIASALRYDGDRLLMTLEGPTRPASVWAYHIPTQRFEELIPPVPGMVDLTALNEPTVHRFETTDGTQVPYLVYPPMGTQPADGWPVLFMVHGGPEAQWQPDFRADLHHYLSRGIMVIAPNVRGSTGYGRPYHEADDTTKRMAAVQDLIDLAQEVAQWPTVNANRIGVMGQSYGGFMVLAVLTQAPQIWKTGVDLYGISNFVTLMETTGPWRRNLRAAEYGSQADLLQDISPVHRLNQVQAPLMFVHCTDDPRVPPEQSEQAYSRLRGLGKTTAIIRIDHEGHGFSRITNKTKAFSAVSAWLAAHL